MRFYSPIRLVVDVLWAFHRLLPLCLADLLWLWTKMSCVRRCCTNDEVIFGPLLCQCNFCWCDFVARFPANGTSAEALWRCHACDMQRWMPRPELRSYRHMYTHFICRHRRLHGKSFPKSATGKNVILSCLQIYGSRAILSWASRFSPLRLQDLRVRSS